ncbi:hypothetical protein BHE74_00023789 [Ensete ventricosum]|nr:hypothetical protein BHE74_00023789 [Ensete ventricosum]
MGRPPSADLVWASTGDDRGRWTSVPDRAVEEEQRRLVGRWRSGEKAAAEEGLSWPKICRRNTSPASTDVIGEDVGAVEKRQRMKRSL